MDGTGIKALPVYYAGNDLGGALKMNGLRCAGMV
jgi:hypothetical protein